MTKKEFTKFFKDFKYREHKFTVIILEEGKSKIKCASRLVDIDTGKKRDFEDHRMLAHKDFNEFELLNYMRNWMMNLAIHENDERIMYKGKKIFNPHKVWSHIMEL